MEVKWLGNACLEVKGKEIILIDPSCKIRPESIPNKILVTHEHDDHIDPNLLEKFTNVDLYAPSSVCNKFGVEGKEVQGGDIINSCIQVLSCDCYGSEQAVSYYYDGLLHTADAAEFPKPEGKVKVVFSACFKDFYSDYIASCKRLNPDLVIPYHYDYEDVDELEEAKGLVTRLEAEGFEAKIIKPGEEIVI
ncbi:MAG: MBL fold metallo-hydrolase [Bacillota bacterium]